MENIVDKGEEKGSHTRRIGRLPEKEKQDTGNLKKRFKKRKKWGPVKKTQGKRWLSRRKGKKKGKERPDRRGYNAVLGVKGDKGIY